VAFIGIGFAFLLIEVFLRVVWKPTKLLNVETRSPHPDYGFAPIPGLKGRFVRTEYNVGFQHTTQRMRGTRLVQAKRPEGITRRLLLLGDSFTYGITCEETDTFAGRLAARWKDVEVINSGCSGYGPREELAVLDRLGAAIRPDFTVLSFFWNDQEDALRNIPSYELKGDGTIARTDSATPPRDPLAEWEPVKNKTKSPLSMLYVYEAMREATVGIRHRTLGLRRPQQIGSQAEKDRAWEAILKCYGLMKVRADQIGTRLVVVCIPDYAQIDPTKPISTIQPLHYEVQDQLKAVCEKLKITYLDPAAVLPREV
jgi:hypothetical protein